MQASFGAGSGVRIVTVRHIRAIAPARYGFVQTFHEFLKIQVDSSAMNTLTPLVRSFVAHFGEMGSRWGINRTVGQIYALIFVSPQPLNADEIAEKLEFSRSNVSMGLKELQAWRLVNLRHLP